MTAREKVENIVMNAGSGQRTPIPTIEASEAAIPNAFFSVD